MEIIELNKLYRETKKYDCCIITCVLNGTVEYGGFAELYEYMFFSKSIFCTQYDEREHF